MWAHVTINLSFPARCCVAKSTPDSKYMPPLFNSRELTFDSIMGVIVTYIQYFQQNGRIMVQPCINKKQKKKKLIVILLNATDTGSTFLHITF